ncbi:MAG: bifunctional riboflavin kinase/FAD synthetase [Lachnospiraceae bacterium]|nr:bifunctional riboflavin kinase/FAD synthetase [Lachnospiraceae bacterium]
MNIITDTQFHMGEPSCVAIGKFDGVHVGHRKLLEYVLSAKEDGLAAVVFTFYPSPNALFTGEKQEELTTPAEKRALFAQMGIDVLWEFPMNRRTAAMAPTAFIEQVLVGQLKVKVVAAGADVSFGHKGAGNMELLKRYARIYGFEVAEIEKVCVGGVPVGSTQVRSEVRAGHMEQAEKLLGRPYTFRGTVCHGRSLGKTLGMPTVNLIPEEGKLFPPFGVYFSRVRIGDQIYRGITNIGRKPTVGDKESVGVETYIYDFEEEIYGRSIEVQLLSYKRPEQRFESVEALKEQLAADRRDGLAFFCNIP